jgi:desulfoferrodoxin (superoxide reductase-like protein)
VNNTDRHHIKTIVIHVNGKETIRHELTAQDSTEGHEGIYKILLKSGDKVRASAFCSIQGSNNTEITID